MLFHVLIYRSQCSVEGITVECVSVYNLAKETAVKINAMLVKMRHACKAPAPDTEE